MKFLAVILWIAMLCVTSCKRRAPAPAVTQVTSPTSTTRPAQVPVNVLLIDGERVAFSPVTVRLRDTGGAVNAILQSAPADSDTGNAIYFDLTLDDIDGVDAIRFAEWHFQADENSDRADSLNGIFLRGRTVVLQPADVQIGFGADGDQLRATIIGDFFRYDDPDSEKPTKKVAVRGRILLNRP